MTRKRSIITGTIIIAMVALFYIGRFDGNKENAEKGPVNQQAKSKQLNQRIYKTAAELNNPTDFILFYLESIAHSITWNIR